MRKLIVCAILAALLLSACAPGTDMKPRGAVSPEPSRPEISAGGQTEQPESAASAGTAKSTDEIKMTVTSSGITDGVIDPKYGHSKLSLPLEISGAPESTACFAVYMDDPDAVPVCGYRFVHWMAANIGASDITEDFSAQAGEKAVQGKNDFGNSGYGGPAPPDKDHTYEITVYALDAALPLSEGFLKDDFQAAVQGHTLCTATLKGLYKK
jgi:Raf kinase inhibitor-like YbhB/YbcL family protein